MSGFARHRRSRRVIATFTAFEADLLRSLVSQVVELLRSDRPEAGRAEDPLEALLDMGGPTAAPEDPVLQRLLPNAYPDDPEAAADFRRYTEDGLRDGKVSAATSVVAALEEAGLPSGSVEADGDFVIDVELDEPAADAWLRAFTDVRLALAVRLGVEEGDEERWAALPDDDPAGQAHDVYEWVGYLQETLVDALQR